LRLDDLIHSLEKLSYVIMDLLYYDCNALIEMVIVSDYLCETHVDQTVSAGDDAGISLGV
jgi:hypothetical protein